MITTVTLNAALDLVYQVSTLRPDTVHRIQHGLILPGGKGVNAARIIHRFGEPVTAAGFAAGHNGYRLISLLQEEEIPARFTEAQGETRFAITVLDREQKTQTEFIEQGVSVNVQQLDRVEEAIANLAAHSQWVLFSGSMPNGCPPPLYGRLIEIARRHGAATALDTSGEALMHGIKAAPYLIKPNEQEACQWAGISPDSADRPKRLRQALTAMMDYGVEMPVISLGAEGAIAAERSTGNFYEVSVPQLQIVSALGSGDAMMAGMLVSASRGGSTRAMLRLGAACGSACALYPGAGILDMEDVYRIGNHIDIQQSPEA